MNTDTATGSVSLGPGGACCLQRLPNRTISWGLILTVTLCGCGQSEDVNQEPVEVAVGSDDVQAAPGPAPQSASVVDASLPQAFSFQLMTATAGIDFVQTSGNSPDKAFPGANGTGCGVVDVDQDGRPDLLFANGCDFPIQAEEKDSHDRLYRNLGGWRFQDVTQVSGLMNSGYSCGVATGDLNSDGFTDFYLTRYGVNQLWLSLGDGTYEEVSEPWGVDDDRWGTGAAIFDYDGDGTEDLYVCNYGEWTWETSLFCGDKEKNVRIYCSPSHVPPQQDVLYRGDGAGSMSDVSEAAGIAIHERRGQGVLAADLNEDGRIDLYVANDIHPNSLYLNQGGRFEDVGESTGTAFDHLGQSQAGMGLAIADINLDQRPDLLVTNYQNEHNAMYLSLGDDAWLETGVQALPGALPWVGWGAVFADFDLDGQTDVFVTNGHTDDNLADLSKEGEYLQPPGVWQNLGGRFRLVRCEGDYFSAGRAGRGLATADLDGDLDEDLVISQQDAAPALLQNESAAPNRTASALHLHLIGTRSSRNVRGTRVTCTSEDATGTWFTAAGGSYASASDVRVLVSLAGEQPITVSVRWPSGEEETFETLQRGTRAIVVQSSQATASSRVYVLPD